MVESNIPHHSANNHIFFGEGGVHFPCNIIFVADPFHIFRGEGPFRPLRISTGVILIETINLLHDMVI